MIAFILLSTTALAALAVGGTALLALYPLVPSDLGGAPNLDRKARRVKIPVGNDRIEGWYLAGPRKATVVIFHGYGRNHRRAWRYGAFLNAAGYNVLAVDFRSSRFVDRKPTTLGHFEVADGRATLQWLLQQGEFRENRIGILGESLGGSVALIIASECPQVAAVVSDCAFSNARLALEDSCERWARLPRWPSAEIVRSFGRAMTGLDPGELDPLSAVGGLCDRPVLFIHGLEDNRLSPDQVRQLWQAAGSKDPLWLLPDTGHNEGWRRHRETYEQRVLAFFDQHLLAQGEGLPAGEI